MGFSGGKVLSLGTWVCDGCGFPIQRFAGVLSFTEQACIALFDEFPLFSSLA